MSNKRFLLHDPEVDYSLGRLSCRRCAKRLSVNPERGEELYEALQLLDEEECAEVVLDSEGMPQPAT